MDGGTRSLAGFRWLEAGNYEEALRWFRRGLVIAPGRVPDDVRLAYYRTLANFYSAQTAGFDNLRLAQEFTCLAGNQHDCQGLDTASVPEVTTPAWALPASGDGAIVSGGGWRLIGFDLDEDVLAAGVDVHGLLYWERGAEEQVERRVQSFTAPNLVPNPGFEFQDLFVDGCVDGYIGSHAFVLPCVSHVVPDPYGQRPSYVAMTETREKGFLLLSSPAPVHGGRAYVIGGWLCADRGAEATVGAQWMPGVFLPGWSWAQGLQWVLRQKSDLDRASCWSRHVQVIQVLEGAEGIRLWLNRSGIEGDPPGRAMFDDLFLFELPSQP